MIILGIIAGMGNQMFGIALYKKLKYLGKDVKIDIGYYDKFEHMQDQYILDYFGIHFEIATDGEVAKYADLNRDLISKIKRKLRLGKNRKTYYWEPLNNKYFPEIFKMDNVYLHGYWQSEKYFSDISESITDTFVFRPFVDDRSGEISNLISETNSVAVHVRRGDYTLKKNHKLFGDICTLDYYEKAMNYFKSKYENINFFVFSDDIEWAKSNFRKNNMHFIDWNDDIKKRQDDMCLMSLCKHQIIANSSFSWWGAWLNKNPSKEVVAPKKWINIKSGNDIWCDDWIKI